LVELVNSGETTTREAAGRLGVKVTTAYGWMKRAPAGAPRRREASRSSRSRDARAHEARTFVRLVRANDLDAAIAVRIGGVEIQVRRGFDADLLRAVVDALGEGAA
jgi:transposase